MALTPDAQKGRAVPGTNPGDQRTDTPPETASGCPYATP